MSDRTNNAASASNIEYPLTGSQSAIWVGQGLQDKQPLYNMVLRIDLYAEIDVDAFLQSFQLLVNRFDALRLTIQNDGVSATQKIQTNIHFGLEVIDLSDSSDGDTALSEWLLHRSRFRFDLSRRLFDSALIKMDADHYVWYLNQHHIATDAWSMSVLVDDMQQLYHASQSRAKPQPQPPQFVDYLSLVEKNLKSKRSESVNTYWSKKLECLHQSSSFYRPVAQLRSGRSERIRYPIGSERAQRIREFVTLKGFQAFSEDLAIFQVYATSLFALIHRLSGNDQMAIGTPTHNRISPELQKAAGLLIEMFPVSVSVDNNESFASLYAKVARDAQQFLMHTGAGVGGAAHSRAFDVVLNYITASFSDFGEIRADVEWLHHGYTDQNHLLRLQVHDFGKNSEPLLYFDLNVDAFSGDDFQRLPRHFMALLDAFLDNPDQTIAKTEFLTREEAQYLEETVCSSPAVGSRYLTVVDAFESIAQSSPDSEAVVCEGQHLSYRELNDKANRFAKYLCDRGVGTNDRVTVCTNRSIETVIAVLGILKAGAAYVPIDSSHPSARIAYQVQNSECRLIIADASSRYAVGGLKNDIIFIENMVELLPEQTDVSRLRKPDKCDTAYVIYTSGSTGAPKGVVIRHDSLENYICWARKYYLDGEVLNFPLFSTLSFDLTVTSLFTTLTSGGCLHVYPEYYGSGVTTIQRVVEDNQVDIVKLTPSHLAIVQNLETRQSRIRKFIVGGEDFKTELARTIQHQFPGSVIFNEYGPTEGTVACMIHKFDPSLDRVTSVPIGKPIDALEVYVLDNTLALIPRGVVGELYIGGAGVAAGYLNNPELTAQRFVDNPFTPGKKLYATGDRVRIDDNGLMHYLGRRDKQVKIRGVRVELGEIESALIALDSINEVIVNPVDLSGDYNLDDRDKFCTVCGISALHPDSHLDDNRVCRICRSYQSAPDKAYGYFSDLDELQRIAEEVKRSSIGKQDCIALLSGGKDSSYALCQLVDMGLTPQLSQQSGIKGLNHRGCYNGFVENTL